MKKKDSYYFSHDSNAKDDPKCVLLIEQLGLEGYGIYWVLIETLRDQPNYKYPVALIPALSRRYNTTTEKMRTVINSYGLFVVDENDFFSLSLLERMQVFEYKKQLASIAGKKSAEKRLLLNSCSTDVQPTFNSGSTIKEKKIKENKSKEKTSSSFDSFWILYPKKKAKGDAQKAWNKLKLTDDLFNTILDAVRRQSSSYDWTKNNGQFIPNAATWLNGGRWEDEVKEYTSNNPAKPRIGDDIPD